MEAIGIIILIWIGWAVVSSLLSAGAKTVAAAGKAAIGKGSFSENMELSFKGMPEIDAKLEKKHVNEDCTGLELYEIQVKGLFPLERKTSIGFVISVFDKTDGELEPVLSVFESCQEADSVVFQHGTDIGPIEVNQGFVSWVRVGVIVPEFLEPPYSGSRDLVAYIRLIDLDNPPIIRHGFGTESNVILWTKSLDFTHSFAEKGYQEASEHRDESVALSLKIGMAVAMADGSLDDAEGEILKNWIIKSITPFSEDKALHLKSVYNQAMKESYHEAMNGELSLSNLTSRLNEISEKSVKYETMELCFEVMAADGIADDEELRLIHNVADALNLDMNEIVKMRDQKIVGLSSSSASNSSVEALLGIDPSWSTEQIKKHLRVEFQKWNNRLNTLDDGAERENAQEMLDKISEARKRYS